MIITLTGCLHGHYPKLEGGDLLIVTGDLTARDTSVEYSECLTWLMNQPYSKKIFIGGNHDNLLVGSIPKKHFNCNENECFEYLCDSGTEFEGLRIWGSPWTKTFPGMNQKCKAFTFDTEEDLFERFSLIPDDIDILITHSPPNGILDGIPMEDGSLFHVGSKALYNWLKYAGRPKLHVFSHIHEAYGKAEVFPTYDNKMMVSVNCSHVNERYQPVNKPIKVIL